MSKITYLLGLSAIALAFLTNSLNAQEITFGNAGLVNLLEDTPGQEVEFFFSGNPTVDSLEFIILIGDGGTPAGGTLAIGPQITNVNLVTQTIFDGGTQTDVTSEPFVAQSTAEAPLDGAGQLLPITDDGVIGVVTFDTTGVSAGEEFDVALAVGTVETSFSFQGSPVTVNLTSGTIAIVAVPEPSSALLVAALGGVVALGRRRVRIR